MSKNKIRHTEHVSKTIPIIKPLLYVLLIGGMIWGLFTLFQPSSDLVPYNKYKKTDVSADCAGRYSFEKPTQTSFSGQGTRTLRAGRPK